MRPLDAASHQRARALARLGAAIAIETPSPTIQRLADRARSSGATVDEIIGTLLAVAQIVGAARLVKATPDIAMAIGYDLDHALERTD